jgi:hypothetical protein
MNPDSDPGGPKHMDITDLDADPEHRLLGQFLQSEDFTKVKTAKKALPGVAV